MNAPSNPRTTSKDLTESITQRIEELAQATDAARLGEDMLQYLECLARFHYYSAYNNLLIYLARPDATRVAGYKTWQKLNRQVRKGERGIEILAPVLIKEKQDDGSERSFVQGFRVVFVFDIRQTDGEPLPGPPEWTSPEKDEELAEKLARFAARKGILIAEGELGGGAQGVSTGGAIILAPGAGTSTVLHELSHEVLHKRSDAPQDRAVRELEAEATAFVVSRHFGLPSTGSPNYLSLHGVTSKMILEHLERVRQTAAEIIQAVEADSTSNEVATASRSIMPDPEGE